MIKKFTALFTLIILLNFQSFANSTEECFEGVSRSVFKFNMVFDDVILEPIAKGYNKLPQPIKKGTNNFTSNIATLLSIPNSFLICKKLLVLLTQHFHRTLPLNAV